DWRSRNAEFNSEKLGRNLQVAGVMSEIAARYNVSTAAVAVAWTLAWPGVTGAIVGARSPKQVDGWIAAAKLQLTPADMRDIGAVITASGAGTGPACPT
ncbi:MAG TPA: aldo/keto reductase, partial [Acetobacteraceae bacterium]|nr:aldo/keto reductase [Acetobacteraceae bacterium]